MEWELREHKVEGTPTYSIDVGDGRCFFIGEHKRAAEKLIELHNNESKDWLDQERRPLQDQLEDDAKAKAGMNHLELSRQKKLR